MFTSEMLSSSDHLIAKSRRHPGAVIPSWVFTKALPAFAAVSDTAIHLFDILAASWILSFLERVQD